MSVVYDQLHEVSLMTEESRGASKTPEDWRWLVRFARLQRNRLGRAYLTVGEPFSLRERMDELAAEGVTGHQAVERVALDISHRLNRATPVTVTAIVSLALLGADRALTVDEVLETVEPLATYIDARQWPVAGAADLRDRSTIRRALAELAQSGVLTAYDGGTEPVWKIGDDQHLVAAFYRNTVIHILVERAIGELALLTVSELEPDAELPAGGALQVGWEEAKRMRDLLKFEFFFPSRAGFEDDLRTELQLLVGEGVTDMTPGRARELLVNARPHLAHLVLRPFLDAYLVLADRLADRGDGPVEEDDLLADSLAVGQQWALQRRVASAESISLELFRTALALARHKGLIEGGEGVGSAREAFAAELRDAVRRVNIIGEIAGEPVQVVRARARPQPQESRRERALRRRPGGHRRHRGRSAGAVGRRVLRPRRHAGRGLHRGHVLRRPAQGPRRVAGGVPPHGRHRGRRRARRRPDPHRARRLLRDARRVRGGVRRPRRAAVPLQDRRHHPARVRALVMAHQRAGHTVAVASAATKYQIAPVARDLGVEHLVCTQLVVEDGQFTGATDGPMLWGRHKASGVRAFAREHGVDLAESYAYGNGYEDVAFLSSVGHPTALNPHRDLRAAAARLGWPVLDLCDPVGGSLVAAGRTAAALAGMNAGVAAGLAYGLLRRDRKEGRNLAVKLATQVPMALAGVTSTSCTASGSGRTGRRSSWPTTRAPSTSRSSATCSSATSRSSPRRRRDGTRAPSSARSSSTRPTSTAPTPRRPGPRSTGSSSGSAAARR